VSLWAAQWQPACRPNFLLNRDDHDRRQPRGAADREWNPDNAVTTFQRSIPPRRERCRERGRRAGRWQNRVGRRLYGRQRPPAESNCAHGGGRLSGPEFRGRAPAGSLGLRDRLYPATDPDGNTNKILIAGSFTSYNGFFRRGCPAFLERHSGPNLHAISADGPVRAIALQPDGGIIIAGDFMVFNDVPQNGMARLNKDGGLDSSFDAGAGALDSSGAGAAIRRPGWGESFGGEATSRPSITCLWAASPD